MELGSARGAWEGMKRLDWTGSAAEMYLVFQGVSGKVFSVPRMYSKIFSFRPGARNVLQVDRKIIINFLTC